MLLTGKLSAMADGGGHTLVFVVPGSNAAAHIVETCPDEFNRTSQPGFDMIARSFQLW